MEIEKLASQLFEMFPENSINRDFILQNAKMMTIPPHKSIIRLTKTEKHELAYSIEKLKVILFNQANFSISILPDLNYVVEINCIGPNNWSPVERRVIVSPSVGVSVLRGSHVFIAGIIAIEDEFLECTNELKNVSVWIDLEEKCKMGLKKRYEGSVKCIGNGQLTISRNEIFVNRKEPIKGVGVLMTEMDFILPSFDNLPRSMFFPQNLPSLLAVESLELEPGLQVLDMCSSPGGKTSHIAQLTKNTGIIVAIDKNRSKIEKLRKNLEACGINHVKCIVADSSKINELDYVHKLDEESRKFLLNRKFDRVLLDPPCSGIGQRPIFQLENFSEIESSYSKYQMKLIDAAVDMLRPGGILVYSTCTVAPAENEGVISYAIRKHPLKLVEPSYSNYSSRSLEIFDLSIEEASLARRFWPYGGPSDTNGFFYAKLKKICDKY